MSSRKPRVIRTLLRALATAASLAAATAFIPAHAAQPATATMQGTLNVVWADPRHGEPGGGLRFSLTLPGGEVVSADIAADQQSLAVQAMGKPVRLQGSLMTSAAPGLRRMHADTVTALAPAQPQAPATPTLATRRVLFVLLKYKGNTQEPHPVAFYKALTNPKAPNATLHIPATINGFFDKTSWHQLQWQGDVAGNKWFTLPKAKTGYANCGWSGACANTDAIANDALTMVKAAGVDLSVYDNINFVLNDDLDCCAWGGSYTFGGKSYGATWEPPWGQETEVYVHEMGHSIGLPHSGWRYFDYDSSWDEMSWGSSAQAVTCGSYRSTNDGGATDNITCNEPGAGYISAHKAWLGWLPAANQVVVNSISTRQVQLQSDALPLGAGIKTIRICFKGQVCTGNAAHFLSVESRLKTPQYDRGITFEGVVIHDVLMNRAAIGTGDPCYFNDQSGWAVPIDATPGDWVGAPTCKGTKAYPNYALYNAEFGVGGVYNDAAHGIKVTVKQKTATGFTVLVQRTK